MGIYVYRDNKVEGPFDELVLQQALANGTMPTDQMCCKEGSDEWIPASRLFSTETLNIPTQQVIQFPKIIISGWKIRWKWSYLFWGFMSLLIYWQVSGFISSNNSIDTLKNAKNEFSQQLQQHQGEDNATAVYLSSAIGANREGESGAAAPILEELRQQDDLKVRLKRIDDLLPICYNESGSCIMQFLLYVCICLLVGFFPKIRRLFRRYASKTKPVNT